MTATIGCTFSIWDNNGGYWDFSFEAKIVDPNGSQVQYMSGGVMGKNSHSGGVNVNLTDPAEGTYTCLIYWWVNGYNIPERQATQTLTYSIPSGETTLTGGWNITEPAVYNWRGRLSGGSFVGRKVREQEGGNDVDTCWLPGGNYPPATGLSGGTWNVAQNSEYEFDSVGMLWQVVDYYRAVGRAPCQFETDQIMQINRGSSAWATYKTNRLKMGLSLDNWVWSYRDGQAQSRHYN